MSENDLKQLLETLQRIEAKIDRISQEYIELDSRLRKCERRLQID